MHRFVPTLLLFIFLVVAGDSGVLAADPKPVTYDDHIQAIFRRHCLQCHGETRQKAGIDLSSYSSTLKGGSGGAIVISGQSGSSLLMKAITAANPAERMPPENDPIPKDQIASIKAWIDNGLKQNATSRGEPANKVSFTPTPLAKIDGPAPMPKDLPRVEKPKTLRPFPIAALTVSPRAALVASATYGGIDFLEPASQNQLGSLAFPEGEPNVLRFNMSGSILMAAGGKPVQNGSVVLFDVTTGKRLAGFGNETDSILAADFAPDEKTLAIGGSNRMIKIFSTSDGKLKHNLVRHTDWITSIAYSPDGKYLATGDRTGNIQLWDAQSGGVVFALAEHKGAVRSLAWRSDSKIFASCGDDGLIVWWDIARGWPVITRPDAHPPSRAPGTYGKIANGILDVAFSPNGELATCGRDQMVKIWGNDGSPAKSFTLPKDKDNPPGTKRFPTKVAFSFDGGMIIAGDSMGSISAWNLKTTK